MSGEEAINDQSKPEEWAREGLHIDNGQKVHVVHGTPGDLNGVVLIPEVLQPPARLSSLAGPQVSDRRVSAPQLTGDAVAPDGTTLGGADDPFKYGSQVVNSDVGTRQGLPEVAVPGQMPAQADQSQMFGRPAQPGMPGQPEAPVVAVSDGKGGVYYVRQAQNVSPRYFAQPQQQRPDGALLNTNMPANMGQMLNQFSSMIGRPITGYLNVGGMNIPFTLIIGQGDNRTPQSYYPQGAYGPNHPTYPNAVVGYQRRSAPSYSCGGSTCGASSCSGGSYFSQQYSAPRVMYRSCGGCCGG